MKVLDLQCAHQHSFEGWFGSEEDFQSQLGKGLVECPMCGNTHIAKMLSAPRLNFGATQEASTEAAPAKATGTAVAALSTAAEPQAAWMTLLRHVLDNTEDVGTQFAEEARRMHYGEADARSIHGQATPEETEALLDEGIDVLPLPMPAGFKGRLQ